MPDTLGGIPIHPLVVHAVVVLIPLASLGVVLIAFIPKWRQHYGALVALLALIGLLAVPIATHSGQQLRAAVGELPGVAHHASLGGKMLYFAIPLFLVAAALWWVGRRESERRPYGRGLTLTLGIVSVVVAIAATGFVAWVGHSGAEAVWGFVKF